MNFFDFFWMKGRPGIFFGVELGALASLGVLLFLFRHETRPVTARVETEVTDDVPTALMLLTVGLLIAVSFLPRPSGGVLRACLRRVSVPVAGVGPCGVRSFSRRLHFQTAV